MTSNDSEVLGTNGAGDKPNASGGIVTNFEMSVEQVGRCLPDYEVLRVIGSGAMGVVYEANHRPLQRRVALKVLPPGLASREATILRFLREAEVVAKIHHEHIVPIYDVGSRSGLHYIAMRFVPGISLDRSIMAAPLSPRECGEIGLAVSRALAFAHRQGIIHRDVKPANILREPDGRVSLTDFGLARVDGSGTMTESGALVGTPNYMSPEQIQGSRESVDGRSDLYSLGVTLYELLTQRPPFQEATTAATLKAILEKHPPRVRKLRPDCPKELEIILDKAMRKNTADRYANGVALADDLERFLNGRPILAKRESVAVRVFRFVKNRRGVFVAGSIAAMLGIGILSLYFNTQHEKARGYITAAKAGWDDPKAVDVVKHNLEVAHEYSSTHQEACLLRAKFAIRAGDRDPELITLALADCTELLANGGLAPEEEIYVLYLQGRFSLQKGDLATAQVSANRAKWLGEEHPRTLILYSIIKIGAGRSFEKQGASEEAKKEFSEAIGSLTKAVRDDDKNAAPGALDPTVAEMWCEAHLELGTAYALLGEYDQAETHFARASALDPRNAEVHRRRMEKLRSEGKSEAAGIEEALAKAINPFMDVSKAAPEIGSDIKNSMMSFTNTFRSLLKPTDSRTASSPAASRPAKSF
ncbi:MAG: protein kinase [Planctomycetes bacterium]|nr:protein kinase [Planctomycetota bacterium]